MLKNSLPEGLTSRPCRIFDWPELARLCKETLPEVTAEERSYTLRTLLSDTRVFELENKIIGYWVNNPHHGDSLGWLEQIAVHPSVRGRGLGAGILRDYEEAMRARGMTEIRLAVFPYNVAAIALYRREGWAQLPGPESKLTFSKRLGMPTSDGAGRSNRIQVSVFTKILRKLVYHGIVRS